MLEVTVPQRELFNPQTNGFTYVKEQKLQMEHSLLSISKWEAKWKKPFLVKQEMTTEETLDYFKCMTLTKNYDPQLFEVVDGQTLLPPEVMNDILSYIDDPQTATKFGKEESTPNRGHYISSEDIYWQMTVYRVPWEAQKWHLNRLLALLKICRLRSQKPKKVSTSEAAAQRRAINEARKSALKTRG